MIYRGSQRKFARRVFFVAGIYGLLVLVPQYFTEARTGRDFPPPITHPEFYYGFVGTALAFQLAFLVISRDPTRYRALMLPSVVEKATFGIATLVLFAQQRLAPLMLAFGMIDLLLGVLFLVTYTRTPRR
ncbi:MAG: hypothetical protein HYR72_07540 [Deltaproteobacteria bacterium]|nr:hypothetical protein [Deltaproteobacteria bacterium]MBI3386942.1 hypothetical protein [Deltaproteobacteria bacterium]